MRILVKSMCSENGHKKNPSPDKEEGFSLKDISLAFSFQEKKTSSFVFYNSFAGWDVIHCPVLNFFSKIVDSLCASASAKLNIF